MAIASFLRGFASRRTRRALAQVDELVCRHVGLAKEAEGAFAIASFLAGHALEKPGRAFDFGFCGVSTVKQGEEAMDELFIGRVFFGDQPLRHREACIHRDGRVQHDEGLGGNHGRVATAGRHCWIGIVELLQHIVEVIADDGQVERAARTRKVALIL